MAGIPSTELIPQALKVLDGLGSSCGYPVYSSLDIRDSGWKVAAVDVNLFPAGFNVLTTEDRARASTQMKLFLESHVGKKNPVIAVVPEAHTNNRGYLENLVGILSILKDAGSEARLLWPGEPLPKAWTLKTDSGAELVYLPKEEALKNADVLLLNHDLSGGIPASIADVKLPTFPSPRLGWYRRRKSGHQEIVEGLLRKIAEKVPGFDPWFFSPLSVTVPSVDFNTDDGLARVAATATSVYNRLRTEYEKRGIPETPRLFIKNDAGTYGMGVVSVKSPQEILEGGRALRNKMRKGKESVSISQVIIQEAIPTALAYEREAGKPETTIAGEPVLYLVNGTPIGGFCRIHEKLGVDAVWENLNQPGGSLEPLSCDLSPEKKRPFPKPRGQSPCEQIGNERVYGFIAKLHATAAGLEACPE